VVDVTLLTPGGMRTAFFDGREEQYRPPDDLELSPPGEVADAVVFALTAPSERRGPRARRHGRRGDLVALTRRCMSVAFIAWSGVEPADLALDPVG
jgi:short-subunit dehydrogenase